MRNIPLIAVSFFLFSGNAEATTAIAVRTPTFIVLGADSKLIRADRSETRAACKIGVSKDVFWGESGILEIPIRNFSIDRIATASMAATGNLDTRINAFIGVMMPQLTTILNDIKIANPPEWFVTHYEKQAALEIVFGAFENGIPFLHLISFIGTSDPISGKVSVQLKRSDSPSSDFPTSMVAALGRHEAADSELSKNPTIWNGGVTEAIRHLIEVEIAAVPDEVGEPITIVVITKDGPRWVSEGQCVPR